MFIWKLIKNTTTIVVISDDIICNDKATTSGRNKSSYF